MKKTLLSLAAVVAITTLQAQLVTDTITANPVIVTATKVPTKQSLTGKVVTVIPSEVIRKSAGKSLTQLLNEQVGITINGALNNAGTNQTLFLRGANGGRTQILIDGIPVSDPTLISTDFDLNLLNLQNVESIEICRGAQSTLYGSDAVAGVINIITTKSNITKPFNGNATISAGSLSTLKANVQLYGAINNKLTYQAKMATIQSKGFSAAYDSTGNKGYDNDAYNGLTASASLQYQLNTNSSIKAYAQHNQYRTHIDAGAFVDEKDNTLRNKNQIAGLKYTYNKNGIQLNGTYQYSDIDRNFYNDSADRPGFAKFSTDDYTGKNQFAELYASINLGSGFTLLQGADYRWSNGTSQFLSISSFGPFRSVTRDTVQSQASAFASLFYTSKNSKFTTELGGRLNVHSRYGSNATYTINPAYNFNTAWRVFGSLATGFKAPSLYQLYSSFGNLNLQPETSKNYEAGIQYTSKVVSSRAVYFNRDITNGIDFNNISFKYFNINRQQVAGIELEASVKPCKGLVINANYTHLNVDEQSQSRVTFKDTTYKQLLRRPAGNFNMNVSYQLNAQCNVSLSGKAIGKRYDVGGFKKADILLDSYVLLGAYAEYILKSKYKLFIDVQNITNTKFFDVRGFNSIPTLINAGVTINW